MKITFLFAAKNSDGERCLVAGTLDQYKAITIANAKLPVEQRRHFIVDRITEGGDWDVMYIETDYQNFLRWRRQYVASYRNRQYEKLLTILSLDAPNPADEAQTMHDCVASSLTVEQEAIENADMDTFRIFLRRWKPWGVDLLEAYLHGNKRTCTTELADKYNVNKRTIQRSKHEFELLVKKYLKGCRF